MPIPPLEVDGVDGVVLIDGVDGDVLIDGVAGVDVDVSVDPPVPKIKINIQSISLLVKK